MTSTDHMDVMSFTLERRSAGILLHPTSLPGRHGCGGLGAEARAFVDFLAAAGQRWWQVLPLGPTGTGDCPYSASSVFAGNPLLIDPDELVADGLLSPEEVVSPAEGSPARVDYRAVAATRARLLRRAFERAHGVDPESPAEFEPAARDWLPDYCLFEALKHEHGDRPWTDWPVDVRAHRIEALSVSRRQFEEELAFTDFVQSIFDRHWLRLKRYANERGIGIIGDLPFYVSHDSCDVWAHARLFLLDERGHPSCISGVPPDYFSETGQLWGHPMYRWSVHQEEGFHWWGQRVQWAMRQFDAVRIDHFLGMHRCWSVAAGAETAVSGQWVHTPGRELLSAVRGRVPGVHLIAEDLGAVTPEAEALRQSFGIPGMRVLQFGFDGADDSSRPHAFPRSSVAYTGTHDNQTIVGWLSHPASEREAEDGLSVRARALRYAHSDGSSAHQDLIRLLYMSPANVAIVPLQDMLGLGDEARMNVPGTVDGNWSWRCQRSDLGPEGAEMLRSLAETYSR